MAAITPSSVYRESLGSLTLIIATLAIGSNSDTYAIAINSPVLAFWAQSQSGVGGAQEPDVTWTPSTGLFLLSSGTVVPGSTLLFILMRT